MGNEMEKKYKNILPELTEYIGTARYDEGGTIIWAAKGEELQHLADVRGWGHLQNKFPTEQDAMFFQDAIGEFIADAINEKLQRASIPEMPQVDELKWKRGDKIGLSLLGCNAQGYVYVQPSSDYDGYHIVMCDESKVMMMVEEWKILGDFFTLTSPPTTKGAQG